MILFRLTRDNEFDHVDVARGFVVAAETESRARQLCADQAGGEGSYPWAFTAIAEVIGAATLTVKEGVLLRDFIGY